MNKPIEALHGFIGGFAMDPLESAIQSTATLIADCPGAGRLTEHLGLLLDLQLKRLAFDGCGNGSAPEADSARVAAGFNRWMDDYTSDPAAFMDTHKSAMRHLNERLGGAEPSYGETCAALLERYIVEAGNK